MRQISLRSRRLLFQSLAMLALWLAGCTMVSVPIANQPNAAPNDTTTDTTEATDRGFDIELLGIITVPHNTEAFGAPVGGLSAIAYDPTSDTYYFLSDDRASFGPTRIYAATIALLDGTLAASDLTWTAMIPLLDANGVPFAENALDPEGLVRITEGFFVSSEGDRRMQPPIAPAILQFTSAGQLVNSLPLPDKFLPGNGGNRGTYNNKSLESVTITPDGRRLISGVENALVQDGPEATVENASNARLLSLDLANALAGDLTAPNTVQEFVYVVDRIPVAPQPAFGNADSGLVDLIALDDAGTLLALERAYAVGAGNTVRLYVASTAGATDVSALDSLMGGVLYASTDKQLLADFATLGRAVGVAPDNLEGMALGPQLPDGRRLLLVVSDNNFSPLQTTQVWALAITLPSAQSMTTAPVLSPTTVPTLTP